MRLRSSSMTGRRAAVALEVAFLLPLLIVLLAGLLDSGRYVMMGHMLNCAVREGARLAVVNTNALTTQDIQNAVRNNLNSSAFPNVTIQVYRADPATGSNSGAWTSAKVGEYIAVDASTTYNPTTPAFGLLPSSITMRAKCVMISEAN